MARLVYGLYDNDSLRNKSTTWYRMTQNNLWAQYVNMFRFCRLTSFDEPPPSSTDNQSQEAETSPNQLEYSLASVSRNLISKSTRFSFHIALLAS